LPAAGQSIVTGDAVGTVTDPSGAVIPGATVTLTNVGTNSVQTTTTESNGFFRFSLLKPAPYTLAIKQTGFKSVSQAHKGVAAVAEFQKLLDHRGIVLNSVTGSLADLQIGRAYATMGDTVKAQASYKDFLTRWKDADPDIPKSHSEPAAYHDDCVAKHPNLHILSP
jgi:hypothetical protein